MPSLLAEDMTTPCCCAAGRNLGWNPRSPKSLRMAYDSTLNH